MDSNSAETSGESSIPYTINVEPVKMPPTAQPNKINISTLKQRQQLGRKEVPTIAPLSKRVTTNVQEKWSGSNQNGNRSRPREHLNNSAATAYIKRKNNQLISKGSSAFKSDLFLAMRVAMGCVIASIIQSRYQYFTPDYYVLGGLSYGAVMVIFSTNRNLGAVMMESWQGLLGVCIALVYNTIVIHFMFDRDELDDLVLMTQTLYGVDYLFSLKGFLRFLPFIIAYSFVILILPMGAETKKFALSLNIYFVLLTNNPNYEVKDKWLLTKNFGVYYLIGIIGSIISIFTMLFPTPIFATRQLLEASQTLHSELDVLFNLILDASCIRNKSDTQLDFIRLRLKHLIIVAEAKSLRMEQLYTHMFWEQFFGIHLYFRVNRKLMFTYIDLYNTLLQNLRNLRSTIDSTMPFMQKQQELMAPLLPRIYRVQRSSSKLLKIFSTQVHASSIVLEVNVSTQNLNKSIAALRSVYHTTLLELCPKVTTNHNVGDARLLSLNLFVATLDMYCENLLAFGLIYNGRATMNHLSVTRCMTKSMYQFFSRSHYSWLRLREALTLTVALTIGCVMAVYVFSYGSTTPSTIALVYGGNRGGSFRTSANRVIGVVTGNIVPGLFNFFISVHFDGDWEMILKNLALAFWTTLSMYVYFNTSVASYSGIVSAFIAAQVFLREGSYDSNKEDSLESFSILSQTSMGVLIFLITELVCFQSARTLHRLNILTVLSDLQQCISIFYSMPETSGKEETSSDHHDMIVNKNDAKVSAAENLLRHTIPLLLIRQKMLLLESTLEPTLWHVPFSKVKYQEIYYTLWQLVNHVDLWNTSARWQRKVKEVTVGTEIDGQTTEIRSAVILESLLVRIDDIIPTEEDEKGRLSDDDTFITDETSMSPQITAPSPMIEEWLLKCSHLKDFNTVVEDVIETFITLFSKRFIFYTSDETIRFLEMKEAFRKADKNGSGTLNRDEICHLLGTVLKKNSPLLAETIIGDDSVDEFMTLVDKSHSGKITIGNFMEAVENGLTLELEPMEENTTPSYPIPHSTRKSDSNIHITFADDEDEIVSPQHDLLFVESIKLEEVAQNLLEQYHTWLMTDKRYERLRIEEVLSVGLIISGARGIINDLIALEGIVASNS